MSKELFSYILFFIGLICLIFWSLVFFDLSNLIYIVVLLLTAFAIGIQSFATERLAQEQSRPIAVVHMRKESNEEGTCFQIMNVSRMPGKVWLEVALEVDDMKIDQLEVRKLVGDPARLMGEKHFPLDILGYRTDYAYLKELIKKYGNRKIKVILKIFTGYAFDDKKPKSYYSKVYEYRHNRWDNEIGVADPEIISDRS